MTITKVKRTDDDKRKAANAANRKSRLKRKLEPIIVVVQNEEIKKNPPGRPVKYFTKQSRDNANKIAWAKSKRLKRQRAKEEEKNTVERTTEEDTKSKIVPFNDTSISQDNDEVLNVQNISVLKDAIDNVQQILQDNIVSSEARKTSYPITRWRENESERKTEKALRRNMVTKKVCISKTSWMNKIIPIICQSIMM